MRIKSKLPSENVLYYVHFSSVHYFPTVRGTDYKHGQHIDQQGKNQALLHQISKSEYYSNTPLLQSHLCLFFFYKLSIIHNTILLIFLLVICMLEIFLPRHNAKICIRIVSKKYDIIFPLLHAVGTKSSLSPFREDPK